jgi:hypothetical protein
MTLQRKKYNIERTIISAKNGLEKFSPVLWAEMQEFHKYVMLPSPKGNIRPVLLPS